MLHMAHALDMEVVAEGVETEEQLHILVREGCDLAQGHLLSLPVAAEEIARILGEGRALMAVREVGRVG